MKIGPGHAGVLRIVLDAQEATILDNLVSQVIALLQAHSTVELDPDPVLASLEVGGTDILPEDPALARLLPDAYEKSEDSGEFRRLTEQSLINRKIEDASKVAATLSLDAPDSARSNSDLEVPILITEEAFLPWLRTLTAIRLAMSARLGVETAADFKQLEQDEESASAVLIFQWLGGLAEAILQFREVFDDAQPEGT